MTAAVRIRVYDNGGRTCDRYTVVYQYSDGHTDVRTMSESPEWEVNQHWYTTTHWRYWRWMGKPVRWEDLNDAVRRAIFRSVAEE